MIGNIFYLWLQRRYAIQTKNMICINLLCYAALCALGLVGISDAAPIGLKNKWEFYVFALVHGVQLGAVQSFSRTLLADLSVPGCEAEFFALYEITDKSSSWMGPTIVAAITDGSGGKVRARHALTPAPRGLTRAGASQVHYAFIYLLVMLLWPTAVLYFCLDHRRGMRTVGRATEITAATTDVMVKADA